MRIRLAALEAELNKVDALTTSIVRESNVDSEVKISALGAAIVDSDV